MKKKARFGVIGTGGWGELHIRVMKDHPFAEVVGVCDVNEQRAKEIAEKHDIPFWTSQFQELLESANVDSVSIVTPDFAHTEPTVASLQAGKNVLMEKPMAFTLEECEKIINAANETGAIFMLDFHNRWSPPFVKAKQAIVDGELGEVQMISYRLNDTIFVPTKMLSWAGKSTVMWFIGSHCLDTIFWLVDSPLKKVFAISSSRILQDMGITTPDFYQAILEFDSGAYVMLENGWILPESAPTLIDLKCSIVGAHGAVYIDGSHHRMLQKYTREEAALPDTFVLPTIHGKPTGFATESIRHFIDCVVDGKEPMVGAQEGLAVTKAIVAIEQSAKTGEPVSVNL